MFKRCCMLIAAALLGGTLPAAWSADAAAPMVPEPALADGAPLQIENRLS